MRFRGKVWNFSFFCLAEAFSLSYDWNGRIQQALDMPERSPAEEYSKYSKITRIARDFTSVGKNRHCPSLTVVQMSINFARIIINERGIPRRRKNLQPSDIGGTAGYASSSDAQAS